MSLDRHCFAHNCFSARSRLAQGQIQAGCDIKFGHLPGDCRVDVAPLSRSSPSRKAIASSSARSCAATSTAFRQWAKFTAPSRPLWRCSADRKRASAVSTHYSQGSVARPGFPLAPVWPQTSRLISVRRGWFRVASCCWWRLPKCRLARSSKHARCTSRFPVGDRLLAVSPSVAAPTQKRADHGSNRLRGVSAIAPLLLVGRSPEAPARRAPLWIFRPRHQRFDINLAELRELIKDE